jgi:alcohol dehydrogenase class IV
MKQLAIRGAYNDLKQYIVKNNFKKVFLVRGKKSFTTTGADKFIDSLLAGINYSVFYDFDTNPQLIDLKKGIELFNNDNYDLIIAIGGGSVLDMAKLISVFACQKSTPEDIVTGKANIIDKKTPLIAIPTTAGTGAEATHFSVLYINKTKYSVAHKTILPDTVFLMPQFTYSANNYLTACTGLDAFCQAIESVWSINATNESLIYAYDAIAIIWDNLLKAVNKNDKKAKDKMLEAAYLAGKAINITKTTAPHAVSYAFTSYYGIPHGHAVALSLPFFFKYNYGVTQADCTDKKSAVTIKKRIEKVLDILNIDIEEIEKVLTQFFNNIGVCINIEKLIGNFDKNLIINNVNTERLNNNPRLVTKQTIETIFR